MSFFLCGLGVVYPQNPQKPKATAEKRARRARLRARQARVSRVRFTGVCLCLFVLCCRVSRSRAINRNESRPTDKLFFVRRNTYARERRRGPLNPGPPKAKEIPKGENKTLLSFPGVFHVEQRRSR
jgi:hypothetical protein